ncbi:unnamed protein product [Ectocarpus sp. 12 AP-2014]
MIERECRTMMTLSHPNIVRLQEVYRPSSGDRLYMVLDRLEGGSADGLWRCAGQLSDDHVAIIILQIILQIVSAIRYCQDREIENRDLKMENYLYEDSSLVPIVKVIDFGLCPEMKDGVTSRAFVGTVLYTAPEILKVDRHNVACDLWSLGVMAFALVSGQFPWYSDSKDVYGQVIKYSPLQFPKEDRDGTRGSYEPAQIKDLELDFLRMDKQGKGEISLEEFKDGLQERWPVLDDPPWPNTPPPGGDSSILGTVSTQNGCPLGGGNNLGGSRSRHQDEASTVLSTTRSLRQRHPHQHLQRQGKRKACQQKYAWGRSGGPPARKVHPTSAAVEHRAAPWSLSTGGHALTLTVMRVQYIPTP